MVKDKKKVYLALSGGVDSAVSTYLLKRQGFDVRGVYMKNWTGTHLNLAGECKWTHERDDAKAVARFLKIPFEVWDFEREYRKWVIDYFFREYKNGRTPNPDVRCNQYVKIPLFLKRALKQGADYIATGHYARKLKIQSSNLKTNYQLLNGVDSEKDQSYFLYTLTQRQLKHLLFPVGEITKSKVRLLARRIGLPVAKKPDSVGICFVGEVKVEDFLKTRIKEKPGLIVDLHGDQLGKHIGLAFYTIGQRHGLGLGAGPWYVIGRKWKANTLIVGKLKEQKHLLASTLLASKVHWIGGVSKLPAKFLVRHRYRHPVFLAKVSKFGQRLRVKFVKPQRAITPGQSVVFYQKRDANLICLGGAIIDKVVKPGFKW
ncbi:MAG: tRNA 2-thiouridine(34) synthase MnmA [Patescibacteria group bacterium]